MLNNEKPSTATRPSGFVLSCLSLIFSNQNFTFTTLPQRINCIFYWKKTPRKKPNPTSLHPSTQRHPMHHPHPSPPPKNGQKSRCLSGTQQKLGGEGISEFWEVQASTNTYCIFRFFSVMKRKILAVIYLRIL